jgi:hypothetical protein
VQEEHSVTASAPPIRVHESITLPVIGGISVSRSRVEVDETVALAVTVSDQETPPDELIYTWTATAGSFTGSGAQVTWRLPKGSAPTPLDVVITVRVTEPFGHSSIDGTVTPDEQSVTASTSPIRVHDSVAELSAMAVSFLVDKFGNSSVSPQACLVDFSDTCADGKAAELDDIIDNRQTFVILSAQAHVISLDINGARTSAFIVASCTFQDRRLDNGAIGVSSGDCLLSAIYEAGRWWLCTSNFSAVSGQGAMFERYRARGRGPIATATPSGGNSYSSRSFAK